MDSSGPKQVGYGTLEDPTDGKDPTRSGHARRHWVGAFAVLVAAIGWVGCDEIGAGGQPQASGQAASPGTAYYVDSKRGRDSNPGTSPRTAWRTLAQVQRGRFHGGDSILLRGGQRFRGWIPLTPVNVSATSRADPLTISSYGSGRATIIAPRRTDGIAAFNVAGVHVSGLDLVGRGNFKALAEGYRRCRDGPAGIRLAAYGINETLDEGITVDHVDVSRFCDGILIVSEDDASRIAHVRVSATRSHDNGDAGVWAHDNVWAHDKRNAEHSIEDLTVTNTQAYRNRDQGGIVLFGVDGGTVRKSVAYANATGGNGGVGIWAFDSSRILFAHNESFRNGSRAITVDGDGFDFDRGVSNSVMKQNYSHDNGGIGFLVCSCERGRWTRFYRMQHIVIRSNVSRNDGSSGQPSLYVLGGEPMSDIDIVSNRVESAVGSGPLIEVGGSRRPYSGVHLRGNRFVAHGGKQLLRVVDPGYATDLVLRENAWQAAGGRFRVQWGNRQVSTRQAWRAAGGG